MAQTSSIKTHPQRREIDQAIIDGVSNRKIGKLYGISETTVRRYLVAGFADGIARAAREHELTDNMFALNYLMKLFEASEKALVALMGWLEDPDDPSAITMDWRAWEIDIVYELVETVAGKKRKKRTYHRRTLQDALDHVEQLLVQPAFGDQPAALRRLSLKDLKFRGADNRKVYFQAIETSNKLLGTWLKTQENATVSNREAAVADLLRVIMPLLMEATDGNGDLRRALEGAFARAQQSLLGVL